jgi:hypothetical protein
LLDFLKNQPVQHPAVDSLDTVKITSFTGFPWLFTANAWFHPAAANG